MSEKKVWISCGGTGGHFYPGLSLAQNSPAGVSCTLVLVGKSVGQFSQVAHKAGIDTRCFREFRALGGVKGKLILLWHIFWSFLAVWKKMRQERPAAVLLMGSFASVPVGLAAIFCRIPLYLHEGNAVVGKSNLFFSRWAKCLFLSFEALNEDVVQCETQLAGFPLRPELLAGAKRPMTEQQRERMCKILQLDPHRKTVLIFGGSQGAKAINQVVIDELRDFYQDDQFQILHIVGHQTDPETVRRAYQKAGIRHAILEFAEKMELCYQVADLAVSRAGAATFYELALFGVPAVTVPLPSAADDHQTANAEAMRRVGAAELIPQEQFNGESFFTLINDWLDRPDFYRNMGSRLQKTLDAEQAPKVIFERIVQ